MPRIVITGTTGIADSIFMFVPRTGRQIDRANILVTALTGNNIDYTAGCITAIYGSARSFDNLNFINVFHIGYLIKVYTSRFGTGFCTTADTSAGSIVYTTTINQNNYAGITIDGNAIVIELITIFTATIAGVLEGYAGNTFDCFGQISIMTFFNFFAGDNLNVTAGTIVGLLSNSIAELVFNCVSLYYHCIQGIIVQVFVEGCTCACAHAQHHHHSSRSCISFLHVTHTLLS